MGDEEPQWDPFSSGGRRRLRPKCQSVSAVAGQYVEEVIDLVLVEHGHLGGALGALDRVVHLICVHPRGSRPAGLVRRRLRLLALPPLPVPLFLLLLGLVTQHLVSLHNTVHDKHGPILRPVLLMSE